MQSHRDLLSAGLGWVAGKRRRLLRWACVTFATLYGVVFLFNVLKPLPDGVSMAGPQRDASGMEFLFDLTYERDDGPAVEQRIFDRVYSMIDSAERFVVLDMFLFNDEHGGEREYRPLSGELARHLIARKAERPHLQVTFITDEINTFYGAYVSQEIRRLREAGVNVVVTRMTRLRDSNPTYSAAWRIFAAWMGTGGPGWLPHPLSSTGQKVTARSYLKLFNFKANHRKLIVTEKECLVTSANPHDASSFHSNIAFAGHGPICADLLESERAVAALSGALLEVGPVTAHASSLPGSGPVSSDVATLERASRTADPSPGLGPAGQATGSSAGGPGSDERWTGTLSRGAGSTSSGGTVQVVTEGEILHAVLKDIGAVGPGDRVDLAMFYLSERQVVDALLQADRRGAAVRLILDPNKDAFGREKGGVPNRQAAGELVRRSEGRIEVQWYDTRGEQFHTKLVMTRRGDSVTVMGGSANMTRRNLDDYNLESDLRFVLPADAELAADVREYFSRLFQNKGGNYTLAFDAYRDDRWLKRALYRFQEFTGLSSF